MAFDWRWYGLDFDRRRWALSALYSMYDARHAVKHVRVPSKTTAETFDQKM
jgi:hypothetical protein